MGCCVASETDAAINGERTVEPPVIRAPLPYAHQAERRFQCEAKESDIAEMPSAPDGKLVTARESDHKNQYCFIKTRDANNENKQ